MNAEQQLADLRASLAALTEAWSGSVSRDGHDCASDLRALLAREVDADV